MTLGSRDLAILSSRVGAARVGASRVGFCPDDDVHGTGADEPGEYNWKEEASMPETAWTLGAECEGLVCGWRPVASFTATPGTGAPPLAVVFTDTSTPAHDIATWAWTFGDGNTSAAQNPTNTYAADGTYTVTLTVTSPKGTATATGTVTVTTPPPLTGTVTGIIYDTDGSTPYVGATVALSIDGTPVDSTVSGAGGTYTFAAVTPGFALVAASAPGLSNSRTGTVTAGATLTLNVTLMGG